MTHSAKLYKLHKQTKCEEILHITLETNILTSLLYFSCQMWMLKAFIADFPCVLYCQRKWVKYFYSFNYCCFNDSQPLIWERNKPLTTQICWRNIQKGYHFLRNCCNILVNCCTYYVFLTSSSSAIPLSAKHNPEFYASRLHQEYNCHFLFGTTEVQRQCSCRRRAKILICSISRIGHDSDRGRSGWTKLLLTLPPSHLSVAIRCPRSRSHLPTLQSTIEHWAVGPIH